MKKVIFFGAGEIGQKMLKIAHRFQMNVDFIVDNNSDLWGKIINNKQIFSPKTLILQKDKSTIIITIGNQAYPEVKKQLEEMGFEENINFYYFSRVFPQEHVRFGEAAGLLNINSDLQLVKTIAPNKVLINFEKKIVYRIIAPNLSNQFKEIFFKCTKAELFEKYIVKTNLSSDTQIGGRSLVFEHEYIPIFSYATEWSPQMFYQYTLFMIDFLTELDKNGLGWSDVHAFNTTFYKGNFIFFDFDALSNKKTPFFIIKDFIDSHIIILLMMAENLLTKAYMYLKYPSENPSINDIVNYLSKENISAYYEMYNTCYDLALNGNIKECGNIMRHYVERINLNSLFKNGWEEYQNDLYDNEKKDSWNNKQITVIQMIRTVKPQTLLDLAGNMGWYEFILHNEINSCIVADSDYNCINFIFQKVLAEKIKNIYPAYLNLITPTTAYYRDSPIGNTSIDSWRKGAIGRFKSDLVLALAIIHHLIFSQQLSFKEIINQFALYTNRWLIIEFIERDDCIVVPVLTNHDFDWYTKENFEKELLKKFVIKEIKKSNSTRTLYLCENIHL